MIHYFKGSMSNYKTGFHVMLRRQRTLSVFHIIMLFGTPLEFTICLLFLRVILSLMNLFLWLSV